MRVPTHYDPACRITVHEAGSPINLFRAWDEIAYSSTFCEGKRGPTLQGASTSGRCGAMGLLWCLSHQAVPESWFITISITCLFIFYAVDTEIGRFPAALVVPEVGIM